MPDGTVRRVDFSGGEIAFPARLFLPDGAVPASLLDAESPGDPRDESARRALNITVAALGLILAAPVLLLVAILVRLSSPGPVFYTQTRVGIDRRRPGSGGNWRRRIDYGGRPFRIYKFRTMYVDASDQPEQVWASPGDPRVTPIGRFLRRTRLDELPQLWNVLRGDMNIVGPRPEQLRIFADLRDKVHGYPRRQMVLPGITGLAQVEWRYDRSLEDVRQKLSYDLRYIERKSCVEDLRIMLRTLPVIVFKRGAL